MRSRQFVAKMCALYVNHVIISSSSVTENEKMEWILVLQIGVFFNDKIPSQLDLDLVADLLYVDIVSRVYCN